MHEPEQYTNWWGTFQFAKEQTRYWHLGNCLLGITRTSQEWQITKAYGEELAKKPLLIAAGKLPYRSKQPLVFEHFSFNETAEEITLTPLLADRNQISRPEFPFYIPVNQRATLYVRSPAWIGLSVDQAKYPLQEIPSQNQSDTWFGNNTRHGELCYANRTRCQRNFRSELFHPHQIISALTIINHASQNLLIERLKLPLPYLSIYVCQQGHLWTEDLTMEQKTSNSNGVIHIEKGLPRTALHPQRICAPRMATHAGGIIHMINEFL